MEKASVSLSILIKLGLLKTLASPPKCVWQTYTLEDLSHLHLKKWVTLVWPILNLARIVFIILFLLNEDFHISLSDFTSLVILGRQISYDATQYYSHCVWKMALVYQCWLWHFCSSICIFISCNTRVSWDPTQAAMYFFDLGMFQSPQVAWG